MVRRHENDGQSSESMLNSTPESVKQEADNLANDLLRILAKNAGDGEGTIYAANIKDLLVDLSIYVVARDHKVLQHGIEVGKAQDDAS
jgi:hypothetical protein